VVGSQQVIVIEKMAKTRKKIENCPLGSFEMRRSESLNNNFFERM
jgi:hypothetical protein